MKTKILIFAILASFQISIINSNSYGQSWLWAKKISGNADVEGGTKIDANNNIYCSGYFMNKCYLPNDTFYSSGYNDIFLAKYDANGNEVWAKKIGANNPYGTIEYGSIGAIDNANACFYFSGTFNGTGLTIDGHSISGIGGSEIFLAKFDFNGNCLWLKKAESYGNDNANSMCLDANNNIYFSGYLFTSGTFDTTHLALGSFLAKIDPNGNTLWARHIISGNGYACCMKIKNNNLLISGVTSYGDTTYIDTTMLIATHKNNDGFIAKFDLTGNCIKAKRFKGHSSDFAGNFVTDASNNIYLGGMFTDTITIDTSKLIANNNSQDLFFCKLDSAFHVKWMRQSHANGIAGANSMGVEKDANGDIYLTGDFGGNAIFGTYNVNSYKTVDMFIAKYNINGSCLGLIHFGGAEPSDIFTGSLNIASNTDLIVSGNFKDTISVGNTDLMSNGNNAMFFARTTAISGLKELNPVDNNLLIIYANPTTGKCNITVPDEFLNEKNLTLSIFNTNGQLIQQKKLEMNDGKIKLNLEEEAKGIYNVTLSDGKKVYSGKIVFE